MKAKCPECGYGLDFQQIQIEKEWRTIINLLPAFSGHGRLVFEYLEKFGVKPIYNNTKKLCRLLEEMANLFSYGKFTHQKKDYYISIGGMVAALQTVCNRNFSSPLTNHNYLWVVMVAAAEMEAKEQGQKSERELKMKEERLREGARPAADPEKNLTGVREILKNIGGQNG